MSASCGVLNNIQIFREQWENPELRKMMRMRSARLALKDLSDEVKNDWFENMDKTIKMPEKVNEVKNITWLNMIIKFWDEEEQDDYIPDKYISAVQVSDKEKEKILEKFNKKNEVNCRRMEEKELAKKAKMEEKELAKKAKMEEKELQKAQKMNLSLEDYRNKLQEKRIEKENKEKLRLNAMKFCVEKMTKEDKECLLDEYMKEKNIKYSCDSELEILPVDDKTSEFWLELVKENWNREGKTFIPKSYKDAIIKKIITV